MLLVAPQARRAAWPCSRRRCRPLCARPLTALPLDFLSVPQDMNSTISVTGSATVSATPDVGKVGRRGAGAATVCAATAAATASTPRMAAACPCCPACCLQVYLSVSVNRDTVADACEVASTTTKAVTDAVKGLDGEIEAGAGSWQLQLAAGRLQGTVGAATAAGRGSAATSAALCCTRAGAASPGASPPARCPWPAPWLTTRVPATRPPPPPPPPPQVSTSNLSIQPNITWGPDGQQQQNGFICSVRPAVHRPGCLQAWAARPLSPLTRPSQPLPIALHPGRTP